MIDAKQSRQKQKVVIELLLLEEKTALNISRRPKQVYSGNAVDYTRGRQPFERSVPVYE